MRSAQSGAQAGQPITAPGRPGGRNGYLDLLRVLAICAVVIGHWLLTSITDNHGQLSGESAIPYISWSGWATLLFQVVPTFFLIGGYVGAISWPRDRGDGASWPGWAGRRVMRLLWPTAVFVAAATVAAGIAATAGADRAEIAVVGWEIAYQLWFLPVYLLLIALTPVMLSAHRRWGLRVPACLAVAAAAVDVAVVGAHVQLLGYANYFLVWGSMFQLGFAWQDGTLTRSRPRPLILAAAGAATLAALLAWSPFPVDMIGAGQRISNTDPPSVALLAYAAAQAGLVIAAEPLAARLLGHPGGRRAIERLNAGALPAYLWHLVPVVLVAVALYPAGVLPSAVPGSAQWWESRPAWIAALAVTLIAAIAALNWLQRPLVLLPSGLGPVGAWSPALLATGLAATMYALTRLAISGFAPGGTPPGLVLTAFGAGLALTLLSGRDRDPAARGGSAPSGSGVETEAGRVQGAQP